MKLSVGERLAATVAEGAWALARKRALLGFDGFIDTLARVPLDGRGASAAADAVPGNDGPRDDARPIGDRISTGDFASIGDFGVCLAGRRARSCSFGLRQLAVKPGGNMPNMASALGNLGCRVDCVGALGHPRVDPMFEPLASRGRLFSYSNPGRTLALEFDDGKVMLYTMPEDDISWETLCERVGREELSLAIGSCDLIGLLNWAEIANSRALWEGLLCAADERGSTGKAFLLVDLADCSKRSGEDIAEVLAFIGRYRDKYRVILSMNEGEAHAVRAAVAGGDRATDTCHGSVGGRVDTCVDMCMEIGRKLEFFALVIHARDRGCAWTARGLAVAGSRVVDRAVFTTGGGDNFNAGLCAGFLLDLGVEDSLALANAAASFYVETGRSPAVAELASSLRDRGECFRPMSTEMPAMPETRKMSEAPIAHEVPVVPDGGETP